MSLQNDSERLKSLLKYYELTPTMLAKALGFKYPDRLYYILRGRNGISDKMTEELVNLFPELSKGWLLTGEGEMLIQQTEEVREPRAENKEAPISDLTRAMEIIASQQNSLQKMSEAALLQAQTMSRMMDRLESHPDQTNKAG